MSKKASNKQRQRLLRYFELGRPEGMASDLHWRKRRRRLLESMQQSLRDQQLKLERERAAEAAPKEDVP